VHEAKDEDSGGSHRRAPGELESRVLAALWEADGPLTATQMKARLPDDLARTTVLTILSRLYDKGMLVRYREGRGYTYEPARDEASHTAAGMHSLLARGPNRRAVLARFVSDLSTQDEQLLQRLLAGGEPGEYDEERP
jgi:predicted transcriptional regulator